MILRSYLTLLFFTLLPHLALAFDRNQLVRDARAQIGVTIGYDGTYRQLDYPLGDVSVQTGVCTDVIIRALRQQNIDLQQLVHEDMVRHFAVYPQKWGLKRTDRNIDHRRVPNLETWFARHAESLSLTDLDSYQPGDIVTWRLPGNLLHIGIVSDRRAEDGAPLIIHNIGCGTQEENILNEYSRITHYRYQP